MARGGLPGGAALQSDCRCLRALAAAALDAGGVRILRDPTRGGVATTLNEFVEGGALGIELDETAIPVDAPVAAACDLLGLDPLYSACEGRLLAVAAPRKRRGRAGPRCARCPAAKARRASGPSPPAAPARWCCAPRSAAAASSATHRRAAPAHLLSGFRCARPAGNKLKHKSSPGPQRSRGVFAYRLDVFFFYSSPCTRITTISTGSTNWKYGLSQRGNLTPSPVLASAR